MGSRRSTWVSGIGAVLIGGLILANYGTGVTPAAAHKPPPPPNPFSQILAKLDEILAAIAGLGGGGQEGNHTLRWDQNLPAAQRFVVLAAFANAAVLDKETGLVWEQSPATTTHDWDAARFQCTGRTTGGRKGWRLPSVHEVSSLVDPSVAAPGPTLPAGHPFLNVQSLNYWSASADAVFPTAAWGVNFIGGSVLYHSKTSSFHVWCVRGGMQESVY